MSQLISIKDAVAKVKDGMTIMVGGFLANGSPIKLIDALAESGVKDLTLICNDTAYPDKGVGKLLMNGQFKKTHCFLYRRYSARIGADELRRN